MSEQSRLTSADHALIHAVCWMACDVVTGDPWRERMPPLIRELLPRITPRHPMMEAFASVATDLLAAKPGTPAAIAARSEALRTAQKFHLQRFGDAFAYFQKGTTNAG